MKNLGLTIAMFLFVGIGSSMAQDKVAASSDATVKTEVEGKHACSADCTKNCCSKEGKSGGAKKACSAEQQKQCSGHSSATKADATESTGKESSAKPKN
jgi:hypothetical protein